MITVDEALPILQKTIKENIRHVDYDRVVDLAAWYHKVITGKDIDALLRRFVRREDDVMFEQRKALTVAITPAVAETLINPFYRIGRLDNVRKQIAYADGQAGADKKVEELNDRINKFWGSESLDKYLATRFIQLGATDPNAWIAVEFGSFDARYEKARPFPVEFSAEQAINFQITNNETDWLIVRQEYKIEVNKIPKKGYRYFMYLPNDILVYTPEFGTTNFLETGTEFWRSEAQNYILTQYTPKGGSVQAMRVGYKLDMETDGRTYVNPFHAAKPYFEKSIKAVSELDIAVALHVHPQKLQRVQPCTGTEESLCDHGRDVNGNLCGACKGTGERLDVSTSGQDIIKVDYPDKNTTPEQKVALTDIVVYVQGVPIDGIKWLDEYIDKLETKSYRTVYAPDALIQASIHKTATEIAYSQDEKYNTLQPFAEHFSRVWRKVVSLIAAFTDNGQGLELIHEFPSDFKLKTVAELYQDLKLAKDSGASAFVIQQIEDDIASKIYIDDKNAYLKFRVKDRFTPFRGKNEEWVKYMMETQQIRQEDAILYNYSDSIFDELENEVPGFFLFAYNKQWVEIKRKIEDIKAQLPKQTLAVSFRDAQTVDTDQTVEV